MGLLEEYASRCKPIDVGCLGLRMTTETTDPVIQIIDGKKQNVGSFTGLQEKTCED